MIRSFRVLGKRGRITIPFEIRQRIGFKYCNEFAEEFEENFTLEDFLDSLSEEEQRDALLHLSLLWAEKQKH